MEKFEGVSLITTMREFLKAYSFGAVQYDTASELRMQDAAFIEDEHLRQLWILITPDSVNCYRTWDVMREGTVKHMEWISHVAQSEYMVVAYAVSPYTQAAPLLCGDIYALNYEKQVLRIMHDAVPMSAMVVHYADGHDERLTPEQAWDFESTDDVVGFTREYPEDKVRLAVGVEAINQDNGRDGNWYNHAQTLRRERIYFEARRIVDRFEGMSKPNSPNQTYYMMPAPACYGHMIEKDRDLFMDFMPYRSFSLGQMKGEQGIYITVSAKEIQAERDELRGVKKATKKREKGGGAR